MLSVAVSISCTQYLSCHTLRHSSSCRDITGISQSCVNYISALLHILFNLSLQALMLKFKSTSMKFCIIL